MGSPIPENLAGFSLSEVAEATDGTLSGGDLSVRGVGTDTRANLQGKLFVALHGEHFDGHAFLDRAAQAGACAALVDRAVAETKLPTVRVASTQSALGVLARLHRRRWGNKLVAVAGSAGKTTTKIAIARGLELIAPGQVHAAPGNLNNLIGVPMVLFGLEARHLFGVVEIGTSAPGEVAELARIAEPDLGVLTVIGLEHTEGLGDLAAIEAEEGALLRLLLPPGVAVANADDERVQRQLENSPAFSRVSYGRAPHATYRLLGRRNRGAVQELEIESRGFGLPRALAVTTPLLGDPGAYATLAAFAVAETLAERALDSQAFSRLLDQGQLGETGRLTPLLLPFGTLLLDDTYNSNPVSLRSSLKVAFELATERHSRLVLVLGEMRELGALAESAHQEAGQLIAELGPAALIAVGPNARGFLEPGSSRGVDAEWAVDSDAAMPKVFSRVRPGDVVLVKASRGVRAERVVKGLVEKLGRAG